MPNPNALNYDCTMDFEQAAVKKYSGNLGASREPMSEHLGRLYYNRYRILVFAFLLSFLVQVIIYSALGFSRISSVIQVPQKNFGSTLLSPERIEQRIMGSIVPDVSRALGFYHEVDLAYIDRGSQLLELSIKIPLFGSTDTEKMKQYLELIVKEVISYSTKQVDLANTVAEKMTLKKEKLTDSDFYYYVSTPEVIYNSKMEKRNLLSPKVAAIFAASFLCSVCFIIMSVMVYSILIDFRSHLRSQFESN